MAKRFILDLNKCTGCQACQLACVIENELEPSQSWRQISTFNSQHYPEMPLYHFSLACNHCEDALCQEYCPALAYKRDHETGAVLINPDNCMGCRYCTWVCPYDAPKFDPGSGIVEKCDFCLERLEADRSPACVSLCPTGALQIEDFNNNAHINSIPGFTEKGIKPKLRIIPLKKNRMKPVQARTGISSEARKMLSESVSPSSKVSPFKEWSLVLFTLLMAWMTGIMCKCLVICDIKKLFFILCFGILGLGIAALHLGKVSRAYRAIFNWRKSWLSREILFYIAFLILTFIQWITGMNNLILTIVIIVAGFMTLISMDMVYQSAQTKRQTIPHSAQVTFTAFFVLSMALEFQILATMVGLFKMYLYINRKLQKECCDGLIMSIISLLRILIGFAIPFYLLFFVCGGDFCTIIWSGIVIGEIIDRFEFYRELEIINPTLQIQHDLDAQLK